MDIRSNTLSSSKASPCLVSDFNVNRRVLTACRRALENFLDQRLANLSPPERKAVDASLQLVRRVLTVED